VQEFSDAHSKGRRPLETLDAVGQPGGRSRRWHCRQA
jgi:hypothetical protein